MIQTYIGSIECMPLRLLLKAELQLKRLILILTLNSFHFRCFFLTNYFSISISSLNPDQQSGLTRLNIRRDGNKHTGCVWSWKLEWDHIRTRAYSLFLWSERTESIKMKRNQVEECRARSNETHKYPWCATLGGYLLIADWYNRTRRQLSTNCVIYINFINFTFNGIINTDFTVFF